MDSSKEITNKRLILYADVPYLDKVERLLKESYSLADELSNKIQNIRDCLGSLSFCLSEVHPETTEN